MDAKHFDAIAKSLVSGATRRRALGALVGSAVGILGLADAEGKGGACEPGCGPCDACEKGACKKKRGKKRCKPGVCRPKPEGSGCENNPCKECRGGTCVNKADDTACNGDGRCLTGVCNQPPECLASGFYCSSGSECCGGVCQNQCAGLAPNGSACRSQLECLSFNCVGYRCR